MSKFTTQSYYSNAVKLLHCSITDTLIMLHSSREPGWTLAMQLQHDDSTINIVQVLLLLLLLM